MTSHFKTLKLIIMKNNLFTLLLVLMAAASAYQVVISNNNDQLILGLYLFLLSGAIFALNLVHPLFKDNN
jgi:predicted ATPase